MSPIEEWRRIIFQNSSNDTKVEKYALATSDASDGKHPPRSTATTGSFFFFAGTGFEAIALGISWVGWRSPKALRWQQRRGYSGRTSERSRDLIAARVAWEEEG